jgi:Cu/Ag efflux protein CusF
MRLPRAIHLTALVVLLTLPLAACSSSKSGGGPKPNVAEGSVSTVSATVKAIDYPTRQVTLEGESGNSVTFKADKRVSNLERVKVGDRVKAAYLESFSIRVHDPKAAGEDATTSADAADWGAGADRSVMREATLTATVERVDRKKGTVSLRGPAGNVYPFRVRDRKNLENVKVGDVVVATYREALAVSIEPVGQ